jgi:hypothetical protein
VDRSNCKPKIGANKTNGNPESNQCAKILAATSKDKLLGDKAICSSVPSAKSVANIRLRDSMLANKAPTHKIPGATKRKVFISGPIPKGKRAATTTKKKTAVMTSFLRLKAKVRSRFTMATNALMLSACTNFQRQPAPRLGGW